MDYYLIFSICNIELLFVCFSMRIIKVCFIAFDSVIIQSFDNILW